MTAEIQKALERVTSGGDLTSDEVQRAVGAVMDGRCSEAEIAALLTSLRMKGETVDEVVGAARAMLERVAAVRTNRTGLLDTCGTGGDRLHTFNISTATALVAASAGVPVAKHGNRSVSSSSGSADVLEALGVDVNLTPERMGRCLDELGIGFCFAPLVHGAMKHAAPVRKQLGFRTIFNLLGPLTNPAGAAFQLVGANRREAADLLAHALARLGRSRAVVVCGAGELDEVSLWGETTAYIVEADAVSEETWTPETFGLPACRAEALQVASAADSARVIRAVLDGEPGACRDIVLANTAAALRAARHVEELSSGVAAAAEAIDSGRAAALCRRLAEWSSR